MNTGYSTANVAAHAAFRRPFRTHRPSLDVLVDESEFVLRCAYEDRELCKQIPGYRWDKNTKSWRYPCRPEVLEAIRRVFPACHITQDALHAVERVREAERAVAALKEARDAEVDLPTRLPLYAHQRRAAAMALTVPHFALMMEQGTGKSAVAVAVAGRRYLGGQITSCLVVCPKSVMPVWQREFRTFAAFPHTVRVLEGSIPEREAQLSEEWPDGLRVAVVNYEATWRLEESLVRFARGGLIIADESQRIKSPSAQQSKAMGRLGKIASYRMILTGTPVTQSPLDIWGQYRFLEPTILGSSFYAFRNRYAIMGGYGGYQVVSYQRLDELVEKVHRIAFRITRAECLDLPPEIHQDVPVELGARARRLYDEILVDAVAQLEGEEAVSTPNVLAQLLRLQQVAGGHVGTDGGNVVQVGTEKLEACLDLLEDLLSHRGRKVIVFCRFVPEIRTLLEALEKARVPAAGLFGETRDRGELVRRFQEEAEPRVLVIQIQTGGLGITLHRADTAVFYSAGWSLADYEQAKARIQRAGQTAEKVQYFHLVAKRTVDERIYEALKTKRDLAQAVVDGWREILGVNAA